MEEEPTFTTIRRARETIPVRPASLIPVLPQPGLLLAQQLGTGLGLRVHALEVLLAPLVARGPLVRVQSLVGATRAGDQLRGGGQRRLPVEDDHVALADDDRGAGDGADLEQRLLGAELRQPVREIADGLVVGEVRLRHPALWLGAEDPVDRSVAAALNADGEVLRVDRLRP